MDTMEPLDELTDELLEFIRTLGSTSTKVSDIIKNQMHPIYEVIDKGMFKFYMNVCWYCSSKTDQNLNFKMSLVNDYADFYF
jgi:hypothetical protein